MLRLLLLGVLLAVGCQKRYRCIYEPCNYENAVEAAPMPRPVDESPGNALKKLASNKFDSWNITGRIDVPRVEVAPMPRQVPEIGMSREEVEHVLNEKPRTRFEYLPSGSIFRIHWTRNFSRYLIEFDREWRAVTIIRNETP